MGDPPPMGRDFFFFQRSKVTVIKTAHTRPLPVGTVGECEIWWNGGVLPQQMQDVSKGAQTIYNAESKSNAL